jgi:hypothetical protein
LTSKEATSRLSGLAAFQFAAEQLVAGRLRQWAGSASIDSRTSIRPLADPSKRTSTAAPRPIASDRAWR